MRSGQARCASLLLGGKFGMFEKIDKLAPIFDILDKAALFICKLLLIADILITTFAVVGRYVSFIPDPSWSEEVVLTLMSYMAVISAALAIHRKSHIRMTAFDKYLPQKVLFGLDFLADIFVMILAIVMISVGWKYAVTIGGRGSYISMPWLSKFWMYFPIPLAGIFMVIFELEALYNDIKKFCGKEVQ